MPPDMGMGPDCKPAREVPQYCLVRVIDVTVEPGKNYEYQLRVRMANPNYKRKDVANPNYAFDKELKSEWSDVKACPIKVAVTPELIYYVVDQNLVDGKSKKPYKPEKYLAFQAHRWLDEFELDSGKKTTMVVGEWAVAERTLVARGMYLGKSEDVKLPVWRPQQQSYVLPDLVKGKKNARVMKVPFEYDESITRRAVAPQAVLVDFEQRGERRYDRIRKEGEDGAPPERTTVVDEAAATALIMSPNGKLLLREGALDLPDEERKARLKDFRERIKAVEEKGKDDPFGMRTGKGT